MIRMPASREFAIKTDDETTVRRELRLSLRSDDTDARSEYGEQRLSVEIVMWRSESPTG